MSYLKPAFHHPELKKNKVGYNKADYLGVVSTLCAGCGHDSISGAIVQACFEIDLEMDFPFSTMQSTHEEMLSTMF